MYYNNKKKSNEMAPFQNLVSKDSR